MSIAFSVFDGVFQKIPLKMQITGFKHTHSRLLTRKLCTLFQAFNYLISENYGL